MDQAIYLGVEILAWLRIGTMHGARRSDAGRAGQLHVPIAASNGTPRLASENGHHKLAGFPHVQILARSTLNPA